VLSAPRSRAAARTNELDAGERRRIIGSEEGSVRAVVKGRGVPRFVAGGVVSQAPIRRLAGVLAGAMAMCPGTGLLSQMIERGLVAGSCRRGERARGSGDPPGLRGILVVRLP